MRYLVNGFGGYFGGIVRVHNAVCRELAYRGTVEVANAPQDQEDVAGVRILTRQDSSRLHSFLRDIRDSLRLRRYDVRIDTAPAFRMLTRARKHIVIVHDLNFLVPEVHDISRKQYWYRKVLHHWTLRRVDRIVVNSHATLREIERFLPSAAPKVRVLPLPVDYLAEHIRDDVRHSGSSESVRLLSFGHAANKGVDRLLELMAMDSRYSLTVVSPQDKWQEFWASSVERLQLSDRIHLLAGLSDEDLADEYHRADVFCMLSTYEGYGLPVAESLYLARPTVVSDLPVLAETSRGAATVAGSDAASLLAALQAAQARPRQHWLDSAELFRDWTWRTWTDDMLEGIA